MKGHLTRAFETLNKGLFNGELNDEIEFTPNLSRKGIFHYTGDDTIEIGASFINASKTEVLDDLLHVMIHVYHAKQGVPDFTQNQYHNRYFCEKALRLGLIVVASSARGWGITFSDANHSEVVQADKVRFPETSAVKLRRKIYREISWSQQEFQNFQRALRRSYESKPHKEYQLKYVCQSCEPPVIIRSGRRPDGQKPLNVTCNDCDTKFVLDAESFN